ncbi:unnamed protein product [Owenia fusiformis]|uniref:Uncharacterized protein n=1 Tax=Owenia fusiformis TaxID=6347 RepID=A0A8S4NJL6_OWEFU|nr:unnamed protein product [Owenia fusiformis]
MARPNIPRSKQIYVPNYGSGAAVNLILPKSYSEYLTEDQKDDLVKLYNSESGGVTTTDYIHQYYLDGDGGINLDRWLIEKHEVNIVMAREVSKNIKSYPTIYAMQSFTTRRGRTYSTDRIRLIVATILHGRFSV